MSRIGIGDVEPVKPAATLAMDVSAAEKAVVERLRRTPEEQEADLASLIAAAESQMSPELKARRAALAALTPLQQHVALMATRVKRMSAALERPDYAAALADPAVAALVK